MPPQLSVPAMLRRQCETMTQMSEDMNLRRAQLRNNDIKQADIMATTRSKLGHLKNQLSKRECMHMCHLCKSPRPAWINQPNEQVPFTNYRSARKLRDEIAAEESMLHKAKRRRDDIRGDMRMLDEQQRHVQVCLSKMQSVLERGK